MLMVVELELEIINIRKLIQKLRERNMQENETFRGQKREIITSQINYFTKRVSKRLFDYDKIAQLNFPIGSGAVENLIRQDDLHLGQSIASSEFFTLLF